MKKLMILGATSETGRLVRKAEDMGVETYVVDPYEDAHVKKFSSHPVKMDCFDVEGLCRLAREEKIDGVLPGCADILVSVYEEVCRKLGKPCYVNEKLVSAFNNKKGLKDALKRHGLPVIEEYAPEEVRRADFDGFPVFVKPVDNNSSKGMYIAGNLREFEEAYPKSLSFSRSGTVLIEAYKECDDFLVGYFARDGKVDAVFTGDRFTIRQPGVGTITSALVYPSRHAETYFRAAHGKMLEIFEELGFRNGICMIQGFVENGQVLFYDPALRITGGQEYVLLEHFLGLDELGALIEFAVSGAIPAHAGAIDPAMNGGFACNLAFSVRGGVIGRIDGADYLKEHKNVINVTQEHFAGDRIDRIGTAQQNIFRIHVVAASREELRDCIRDLQAHVAVYDENGEDMTLPGLDAENWYRMGAKA
ncbi:MAG: hypothetical protein IKN53_00605 [Oscillibacter sp.]|nr:hypothetical protein [Oscillibacter sp.]